MSKVTEIDGLPVIDATEPMILTITRRDIRGASRKEPGQCAMARAIKRQFHVHEARIHLSRTYLRQNNGNWVRYVTPLAARDEIIAFDKGGEFAPIEIALKPVWPSEKAGTKRASGPRKTKGKPRATPRVVSNVRGGPA